MDDLLSSYGFDWVNDLNAAQEADTYSLGAVPSQETSQPQEAAPAQTVPEQTFENSFFYKPDVAVQGGSNWWEQNVYESPWNQEQNLSYQNPLAALSKKPFVGLGFYSKPSEASTEFNYNPYSYTPTRYNQTPSSSFSGLEQLFYDQVTPVADSWWALNTPTGIRFMTNLAGTGGNDTVEKNPFLDKDLTGYGYVPIDYAKQLTGQDLSEAVLLPEGYNPQFNYQLHQPGSEDTDIGKMLATMLAGGALGYFAAPALAGLFSPAAGAGTGLKLGSTVGSLTLPAGTGIGSSFVAATPSIGLSLPASAAGAGVGAGAGAGLGAGLSFSSPSYSILGPATATSGAGGLLSTGFPIIDNLALNASKAGLQELVASAIQGRDINPTNILTGGLIPSLNDIIPSTGNKFFDQILQGGVGGGIRSGAQGGDILQGVLAGAGAPIAGFAGNLVSNLVPDTGMDFLDKIINESLKGGTSSGLQSLFSGLGGNAAYNNMLLGSLSSGLAGAGQAAVPRIEEFISRNVAGDPVQTMQAAESLGLIDPNMPVLTEQREEEPMFEDNDFTFTPDYSLGSGQNSGFGLQSNGFDFNPDYSLGANQQGFGLNPNSSGFNGLTVPENNNFLTPTFDQYVPPQPKQQQPQQGSALGDLFKSFATPQNIGTLISGLMSRNQGKKAATAMARNASNLQAAADPFASQRPIYQEQLRKATLDPLAIWNSPEYQGLQSLFREEIERKDAAAGRRSQYGSRSERLQKHFLDYLMNYRNQMSNFAGAQFNPAAAAQLASGSYSDELKARNQAAGALPGALGSIFEQMENARTRKLVDDYLARLGQ